MTRLRTRSARSPLRPRPSASPPPLRRATTMPAATTNNPQEGYALFDTAIGRCALVWRGGLVVGAALPETSDERARASLARRFPGAAEAEPPPFAAAAIERIAGLLAGGRTDLADIKVDLGGSAFERNVW